MKKRYLRLVRKAFRALRHPNLRRRQWWRTFSKPLFQRSLWMPCRDSIAMGLSIGLFFSMIPAIPQSIFAAVLAMCMRGNVPIAMAACFISNPFTNVPFWLAQNWLGGWVIDVCSMPIPKFLAIHLDLPGVGKLALSNFLVGSVALGLLLALFAYPLIHVLAAIMPQHLPVRKKKERPISARLPESANQA